MHLINSQNKKYDLLKKNSKDNGDFTRKISFLSERAVALKLSLLKFEVYLPELNSSQADLICINKNKLFKIQVNTATYDRKADWFNAKLASRYYSPWKKGINKTIRYHKDDIDFFIVSLTMSSVLYVIPFNVAQNHSPTCFFYPHRKRKIIQNKGKSIETENYLNAFNLIK